VRLEGPEVLKITDLPRGTIYCLQASPNQGNSILQFSGTSGSIVSLVGKPNPELQMKPRESYLVPPEELLYYAEIVCPAPKTVRSPVFGFDGEAKVLFCDDGSVFVDGTEVGVLRYEGLSGKGYRMVGNTQCYFRTIGGGLAKLDVKEKISSKVEGVTSLVDFQIDDKGVLTWLSEKGELITQNFNESNPISRIVLAPTQNRSSAVQKTAPDSEDLPSWHAMTKTSEGKFICGGYNLTHPHANSYILSTATETLASVSQGPHRSIEQGSPDRNLAYHVQSMASLRVRSLDLVLSGLVRDQIDLLAVHKSTLTLLSTLRHSDSKQPEN
jgi:hypothetical protein